MISITSAQSIIELSIFIPVLSNLFADYRILQNNYRHSVIKGYLFLIMLPFLFVGLSCAIIEDLRSIFSHISLLTLVSILLAYLVSTLFFEYRKKVSKIELGSESWFMNRFYRDMLYAIFLSVPAIMIRFCIT